MFNYVYVLEEIKKNLNNLFEPKMLEKKVSIILPTYNEKENIIKLIDQIKYYVKNPLEIIVVDDNSPDKTWKIVQDLRKDIKVIRRINTRGLASAIATGIENSTGNIIICMDCDFCHPPKLIPELISHLNNYDIVVASRYIKGGKDKREFPRVLASKLINLFANYFLKLNVKDYTGGYIATKKKVFKKIKVYEEGYGEYFIHFLYFAKKHKLKIKEIPYTFTSRTQGETKTSPNLFKLLKLGFSYCLMVLKLRLGIIK